MIQVRERPGSESAQNVVVQTGNGPSGLIAALDRYDYAYRELKRVERSTARMMLDKLDEIYPPSPARDELRDYILDRLAWESSKIQKWLRLQFPTEQSTTPSPRSNDSSTD